MKRMNPSLKHKKHETTQDAQMKNCENIEKLQSRKNITCLELSNHQT
jgi:hypothetical protein